MKKLLVVLLFVLSVVTAIWFIIPEKQYNLERYYVGIGATLERVDAEVKGMVSSKDGQVYSNEKGQLTGLIVIRGILKDSPATHAGLQDMDVVLAVDGIEVDGKEVHAMSIWGVNYRIENGKEGDDILFKIRRIDVEGNSVGEFEINVKREKIDRVAWLTQDLWLTGSNSSCGSDGCRYDISFSSKFQEDKVNGRFIYRYKAKNSGKYPVTVSWEALEGTGLENNFSLQPGESRNFYFISEDFPTHRGQKTEIRIHNPAGSFLERTIPLSGINKIGSSMWAFIPANRVD